MKIFYVLLSVSGFMSLLGLAYFAIEQSVPETGPVIPPSEVLDPEVTTPILPNDSSYFWLKFKAYFNLFIQGDNLKRYFVGILRVIGDISQILLLVIPLILLFVILIKKIYGARNTNYNQDTKPLKAFKAISGVCQNDEWLNKEDKKFEL